MKAYDPLSYGLEIRLMQSLDNILNHIKMPLLMSYCSHLSSNRDTDPLTDIDEGHRFMM